MQDYYAILGIASDASQTKTIKAAYRKKALAASP
jgi:curved DNA-binding protein CbpA